MHAAAKLQFEGAVREFARWRAVPEERRHRPGGGNLPEVMDQQKRMPPQWCQPLELSPRRLKARALRF
jgi:hypothetical protein